jgi:hypothetical protein
MPLSDVMVMLGSTLQPHNQLHMITQRFDTCFDASQVAAAVADRLAQKEGETALFPALQNLGRGIKSALPTLRHSIRHCIEVSMLPCNYENGGSAVSAYLFACSACNCALSECQGTPCLYHACCLQTLQSRLAVNTRVFLQASLSSRNVLSQTIMCYHCRMAGYWTGPVIS